MSQKEGEILRIKDNRISYRILQGTYSWTRKGVCRIQTGNGYSDIIKYYPLAKGLSKLGLKIEEEYEFELTRRQKFDEYGKGYGGPLFYAIPIVNFERIK